MISYEGIYCNVSPHFMVSSVGIHELFGFVTQHFITDFPRFSCILPILVLFSAEVSQEVYVQAGHGTNVDGTWLRSRTPKTLKVGSVIRFGASTRSYKVGLMFCRAALASSYTS